jgi:hypothetical protein
MAYKISSNYPAGDTNQGIPTADRTPSSISSVKPVGAGSFFPNQNASQPSKGESQHGPYGTDAK